jgi:hypothetical protein
MANSQLNAQTPTQSRVKIMDPATESPFSTTPAGESKMHSHSQSTILNTRDHMQAVVEMFAEHLEFCAEPFKEEILKKVNELKGRDAKLLTSFVRICIITSLD